MKLKMAENSPNHLGSDFHTLSIFAKSRLNRSLCPGRRSHRAQRPGLGAPAHALVTTSKSGEPSWPAGASHLFDQNQGMTIVRDKRVQMNE